MYKLEINNSGWTEIDANFSETSISRELDTKTFRYKISLPSQAEFKDTAYDTIITLIEGDTERIECSCY